MNFKGKLAPYLLLLPAFMLICWFKLYPILSTLKQAFVVNGALSLANYQRVFAEKTFWNCLNVTLKFNVVTIPLQIIISFLMALLVSSKVRGTGVFRTIFYIPFAVSITVCVMVWNLMFQFNGGVVNSFLSLFGVPPQGFFNDRKQALWCIVVLASWKGCGYWMMFLMAGIKNIDSSVYEAARIDGCSRTRTFFSIVLPLCKPGLATVAIFAFVNIWNDLLISMVLIPTPKLQTLNLSCFNLRGQYVQHYGLICAGLMLVIIPVVIVYFIFQEQLVKGLTAGAVKS